MLKNRKSSHSHEYTDLVSSCVLCMYVYIYIYMMFYFKNAFYLFGKRYFVSILSVVFMCILFRLTNVWKRGQIASNNKMEKNPKVRNTRGTQTVALLSFLLLSYHRIRYRELASLLIYLKLCAREFRFRYCQIFYVLRFLKTCYIFKVFFFNFSSFWGHEGNVTLAYTKIFDRKEYYWINCFPAFLRA